MDDKTVAILAEYLANDVQNIKKLSTSTADDYGFNITYFTKLINEINLKHKIKK